VVKAYSSSFKMTRTAPPIAMGIATVATDERPSAAIEFAQIAILIAGFSVAALCALTCWTS
jgi:hypothetical protein